MNQQIIKDAFIAKLSGIAEHKNDKEIWWEDLHGNKVTIEFVNNSIGIVIVRLYHDNGNKWEQRVYKDGKLNGKCLGWYNNGSKMCVENYKNNKRRGKHTFWSIDGVKNLEYECKDGEWWSTHDHTS